MHVIRKLSLALVITIVFTLVVSHPQRAFAQTQQSTSCQILSGTDLGEVFTLPGRLQVGAQCTNGRGGWGRVVGEELPRSGEAASVFCEIAEGPLAGQLLRFPPPMRRTGIPCADGRGNVGVIAATQPTPAPTPTEQPTQAPQVQYSSLCAFSTGVHAGVTIDFGYYYAGRVGDACSNTIGDSGVYVAGASLGNSTWCAGTDGNAVDTGVLVAVGTACYVNGYSGTAVPPP